MIFFTVNPIIFGEVLTAKKHVICWNITTYKNIDVKLLHPVWKDLLDTVILTRYWKQLIIFLFDIQCFFQSGSECGPWTKIIGNSFLVIQKIHLDFLLFFYLQCKSMVEYILVCPLQQWTEQCVYWFSIRFLTCSENIWRLWRALFLIRMKTSVKLLVAMSVLCLIFL